MRYSFSRLKVGVYDRREGLDKVIRPSADEERISYKGLLRKLNSNRERISPEHEAARTEIFGLLEMPLIAFCFGLVLALAMAS